MISEKFWDIFEWVLAVIAVIVAVPLAIVLMPLILIAVFILSCYEEYLEKQKEQEGKMDDKTAYDAAITVDDFRVSAEDLAGAMVRILLYVDGEVVEVIEEIEYDQDGQPIQQPIRKETNT